MEKAVIKDKELESYFDEMEKQENDVQGLIRRGYKSLPAAQFLLLRIENGAEAKKYFNLLADTFVTSSNKADSGTPPNYFDERRAVQIAFTSSGLRSLAMKEKILETFSREFIEGMTHAYEDPDNPGTTIKERSTILGDIGANDPDLWHWGSKDNPVDCILLLYAQSAALLDQLILDCFENISKGVSLVYRAETFEFDPKGEIREHFGFRDGISQPIIKGFKQSRYADISKYQLINPGEIILGHKNEYNNYSPSPWIDEPKVQSDLDPLPGSATKKNLGKNGAYLVFRQMEQHVETFYEYVLKSSKEAGETPEDKAIKLAAKMIGRWPDGQSLAVCPEVPCAPLKNLNEFLYFNHDRDGTGCPFGAHIRRTNPRDQVHAGRGDSLSLDMSRKHRILRRGRIYGEPVDRELKAETILEKTKNKFQDRWVAKANTKTPIKRGIHFMCLVSDIARQFEFVQSVWSNTPSFGELGDETDPIISPRFKIDDRTCDKFTTPQGVARNRYKDVPMFTSVVGGAYFFMPGIKALRFILR